MFAHPSDAGVLRTRAAHPAHRKPPRTDLLVLDGFGLAQLNAENRRGLLELLEDRYASLRSDW